MGLFEGKTVFISGAARGQGRAHAIGFAAEGANVVCFDLCGQLPTVPFAMADPEDLAETERRVALAGRSCLSRRVDVRDAGAVESLTRDGLEAFGSIDIVVANAGIVGRAAPVWDVAADVFRDVVDTNLIGVWNTFRPAVAAMVEAGRAGSVVLTASGAAVKGLANIAPYVASKHGLIGLMRTAARELAPHGIRVNCVLPGNVNTPMFQNEAMRHLYVPETDEPTAEAFATRCAAGSPMGIPWVEPEDVTAAAVWLCSDAARYVTGVALPVDGGTAIP